MTDWSRQPCGVIVAVALVGLLAAGCTSTIPRAPSAPPSPGASTATAAVPSPTDVATTANVPSPTPRAIVASPSQKPGPTPEASCYDLRIEVDYVPSTLGDVARRSEAVAVATFAGYGQAAWNTPDGKRPSESQLRASDPIIVRRVHLDDVTMLRGDAATVEVAQWVGGQLGCDSITFSEPEDLVPGTRYVMFLSDVFAFSDYATSGNTTMVPAIGVALALNASDVATAEVEGPISLTRIMKTVRDNPYLPPAPPAG